MALALIVACAENRVIGRDGGLPWHLPDDLRRFRELTTGHAIVMGRRTWESIGRPLPKRRNLVVTRARLAVEGIETFTSYAAARDAACGSGGEEGEAFVIGGERLYAEALPDATRLHRTLVHAEPAGDAFFPEVDWAEWERVDAEPHPADERHEHAFTFETWERRPR